MLPFRLTLHQDHPTVVRFAISLCMIGLFCSQAVAESGKPLRFQLRNRTPLVEEGKPALAAEALVNYDGPWKVDYRTVEWDPAKTVVIAFDVDQSKNILRFLKHHWRSDQMSPVMGRVLEKLHQEGVQIFPDETTLPDHDWKGLLETLHIENVIIIGNPAKAHTLVPAVKNVVVMRDMADIAHKQDQTSKTSEAQEKEQAIKHIEKYICPTVTSTDVLGEPAFCPKEDRRPHVAIIVSDDHYKADVTFPIYADELREKYNCRVSILHGEGGSNIHGIEELKTADCLIVFVRRLALPKSQLDAIRTYVASGRPVIGLRTASHAFDTKGNIPEGCDNWVEFDAEVLGGNYHNHAGNELGSDIAIVPEMKDHPILAGVEPPTWHSTGSLYFTGPIKPDCTLLMTGSIPNHEPEPVLWFRKYGQSPVLYCVLGHPDDFQTPQFRRLLANMILWSVEQKR